MNHAINLSKPKIIFVSPPFLKKSIALAQRNAFVKQVIVFDNLNNVNSTGTSNILSMSEIMNSENPKQADLYTPQPQNMKENVGLILCSSGTTGLPKGVQLTQFNMFAGAIQYM